MLTAVHSARPSSRSSLHSSTSIGSYGPRRPSSAPTGNSKGILVSTSRSGAARSAAILLISSHISALDKNNHSKNDDNMTKHIQTQLNVQRQRLQLELPPNTSRLLSKLLKRSTDANGDEYGIELSSNGGHHIEIGALPTPASEMAARVAVKAL